MREATSQKEICTARISMIMYQKREQEEWPYSNPLRILFVGPLNATTIPVESSIL